MISLVFVAIASIVAHQSSASLIGLGPSALIAGPAGIGGAAIIPPTAAGAVIAGPAAGLGLAGIPGLGLAGIPGLGLAGVPGLGLGGIAGAWGLGGLGAITNGGGAIGVSGLGATVKGPPTAPVVVAGPSGKIAADGLWGPTTNIGGAGIKGW